MFTAEQEQWLEANFANTSNDECARHCGCSPRTVIRKARAMGLDKSRDFMRQAQANAAEAARIMNQGEGNSGKANLLKYGKAHQFKPGITSRQRLGDERENERLRKAHKKRNETISKDYLRLRWGFEPKTRLIKHLPKNQRL